MKRFILHVGFHKTATSSIQRTLSDNDKLLFNAGYYYPVFFRGSRRIVNHSIPFYSVYCEKPELYHVNIRNKDCLDMEAVNKNYHSQIEELMQSDKNVIVSGEDISVLSECDLVKLRDEIIDSGFKLEVFCVVRSPYSFLCSSLQERIKNGSACLKDVFVGRKVKDVLKLKKVFSDKVEFLSFEEICRGDGPVVNFINMLGIDCNKLNIIQGNEGLGNLSTRALANLNISFPIVKEGKLYNNRRGFFSGSVDSERFLLTEKELDVVKPALLKENSLLGDVLGEKFTDKNFPCSNELKIDIYDAVKIYSMYKESHTSLEILRFIQKHSVFNIANMCYYFSNDVIFLKDIELLSKEYGFLLPRSYMRKYSVFLRFWYFLKMNIKRK
nr:hypothetical protein [uncultured Amphritea sp.]